MTANDVSYVRGAGTDRGKLDWSIMPTLQGSAVKVDENQLLELASLARKCPFKRGPLQKADAKGKKSSQRWCYIYQNMLFYYETETSSKPLGMLLLEGAMCRPLDRDVSSTLASSLCGTLL